MRRLTPALALLALCLPVPAHAGPIRNLIHRIFHGGAGASACATQESYGSACYSTTSYVTYQPALP